MDSSQLMARGPRQRMTNHGHSSGTSIHCVAERTTDADGFEVRRVHSFCPGCHSCTMGVLTWLRRLYSLDTLDTRFTVSAGTPLKSAPDASTRGAATTKSKPNSGPGRNGASPAKWNSAEFYAYYVFLLFAIPMMFKAVFEVSLGK